MSKTANILFIVTAIAIPFGLIGPMLFVIPAFVEIYDDMLGAAELPLLTQSIVEAPRFIWLALPAIFAVLNITILQKTKNAIVTLFALAVESLLAVCIIIGLFLPIQETITHLDEGVTQDESTLPE